MSDIQAGKQKCKVLIIGAGAAGLSAARQLAKSGLTDFKVLEARKRVGGRIVQVDVGGTAVELGANWIHGVLGNPIFELAMAHGLVDITAMPKPHKVVAALEDGKQVPFGVLKEIYEAYVCFLKRCEEYMLCQYLPPEGIDNVGAHIQLEYGIYLDKISDSRERHLRQLIFDCLLKRETCITGCDSMNDVDLLELGSYVELQGGNIILPSGYSSILKPLCDSIPPGKILLEHPVKLVHWYQSPEVVADSDSDDSERTVTDVPVKSSSESSGEATEAEMETDVVVTCENGSTFYADHLICTIPLGVLKATATEMFQPSLPEYKLESIEKLMFGTVDKIILEYERPFLNHTITEVMLLWETEDSVEDSDICRNWYKKIYSFSKVTETLLLGWISGREAEYMETLSHEEVGNKCTEILRKFLNDPFVPKPKTCVCTSWKKQPYTRGAYTSIAVGASQVDIENLAQPLYSRSTQSKPTILFAGEHTHPNFYSTAHGAYLSGRSVAQSLLVPEEPEEIVVECDETDLSSWIQGIALD